MFWSSYAFVQIAFSQDFMRILEENCGGDIVDRRRRFNSFVENTAKKVFWFRYTFVERLRSLHFLSFYKKIVASSVDINNGRINCKNVVEKAVKIHVLFEHHIFFTIFSLLSDCITKLCFFVVFLTLNYLDGFERKREKAPSLNCRKNSCFHLLCAFLFNFGTLDSFIQVFS